MLASYGMIVVTRAALHCSFLLYNNKTIQQKRRVKQCFVVFGETTRYVCVQVQCSRDEQAQHHKKSKQEHYYYIRRHAREMEKTDKQMNE